MRQLEPLYGQNLASESNPSQGSPAPERPQAGGEAGPSSPNNSAGEWEIRPSSTRENRRLYTYDRPSRSQPVEQPEWGTQVLIPVRRYDGFVDVSIINCIGRAPDDTFYNPQTSMYHVIGLTDDAMIIM